MQTSTQQELATSSSGPPPQPRRPFRGWSIPAAVVSLLIGTVIGLAAYNFWTSTESLMASPAEADWDVEADLGAWTSVNKMAEPVLPVPDAVDPSRVAPAWGTVPADSQILPVGGPEWATYEVPDSEPGEPMPVWLDGTIELIDETDLLRAPPRQVSGPPAFRQ